MRVAFSLVVVVLLAACRGAPEAIPIQLWERASEQWVVKGVRYPQGGLRLDDGVSPLATRPGERQRLNGSVRAPDTLSLERTILSWCFPTGVTVQRETETVWAAQGHHADGSSCYFAHLRDIGRGMRVNAAEAIYFQVPVGTLSPVVIAYTINTFNAVPFEGTITVVIEDD